MGGYLADHTAEAIDRSIGRDSAIVVPVGAIEQHGRHLPKDEHGRGPSVRGRLEGGVRSILAWASTLVPAW